MSAVYPYHPDRPRNMINTNKMFDLFYAAEESESTPTSSVPLLTKSSRSALIKRRKTRKVPARLKLLWDEEVTTPVTPFSTQSVRSTSDSIDISPSLKSESLPICLQAPAIDSILPVLHPQSKSLGFETHFEPQTSVRFTFSNPKEAEQAEPKQDQEEQICSSFTLQHLFYIICIGALIAAIWTRFVDPQEQRQPQHHMLPISLTSATLTPSSMNAVRIFVTQHRSQFSFTLRTTRLLLSR
eukprot:TRINITY_DN3916_c0_g1_i13.p1 TRINITY_DN3916_c0_g1~~TRINITY_DN3916_c0_g1_i13.p1  ORF type:complete len:241 (+),score=1.92 TRINITY_DN3916_c0_g1_i13:105-827(+)